MFPPLQSLETRVGASGIPHLLWSLTKLVKTAEEFLPDSVLLDLSTQLRKKEEISQFLPFQAPLVIDPFSSSNSY